MSRIKYAIYSGREYYDWNDLDSGGYPKKKWYSYETRPDESDEEPIVGNSWTYEEYGKKYRKTIMYARFKGMEYEDVEGYDVEYYTEELNECFNSTNN